MMAQATKTILLVEDDATNRKLVRVVLGDRKRYRILEASGVAEALAQLRTEKPDLLLLDIRLEDGSGLDVIAAFRADRAFDNVPAVALTAQAMKDDEARFLAAGFDGYLSKPVDTRRLPEVVDRFIDEGRKAAHA
jgi:CheY-like chemotaxis protein